MRRPRKAVVVTVVTATCVVIGLTVAIALVRGFGPGVVDSGVEVFTGIRCDDELCPPDAEWVRPVEAPVTSGFRTSARPDHHGVDLSAARGDPVVAASAGVVVISECSATLHGEPYGCDQDGSPEVRGCGWYVKILHAHRRATLYCHFSEQPAVAVGDPVTTGQLVGYVGSTGNSSEPHLHFEVQQGRLFGPPRSANAVDPVPFMTSQGAPLS